MEKIENGQGKNNISERKVQENNIHNNKQKNNYKNSQNSSKKNNEKYITQNKDINKKSNGTNNIRNEGSRNLGKNVQNSNENREASKNYNNKKNNQLNRNQKSTENDYKRKNNNTYVKDINNKNNYNNQVRTFEKKSLNGSNQNIKKNQNITKTNTEKNKMSNIEKNTVENKNAVKTENRDTSGDTKVFQIVRKEDIDKQKRIQSIKNENVVKKENLNEIKEKNIVKYNDYKKNNTGVKLNNYEEKNKPVKPKKGKKAILITILIILMFMLIMLIALTVFGLINKNSNKIIKGVYINNIEVSNLTKEAAIEKINTQLNNEESNYIIVTHGEYSKEIHLSDIEGTYNTEESVETAYSIGRSNNIIEDNFTTIETMVSNTEIPITFTCNDELLDNLINKIAIELPDVATDSSYIVDNNKVIIKNSKDGIQIKSSDFKQEILNSFATRQSSVKIPVEQAQRKEIDVEKIHEEIYKEPKNAYYTTNPYQIYKEEDGLDFAISIEQAKEMLLEDKEEYEIQLKVVKPKITVENLDSKAFPNQLSTFTTNYGTADVNRNANIAIAAKSINSAVVMPGETFSFNNLIGECSTRTGYKESTIYLNGELSTGIGGGICQVSTTLYNAVLRANLEIVDRRNHSLGVTYVPSGQDAMVSIGSQDFKFKNNRDYPVKVVAFVGTGSITCQIYGLKKDVEYDVKLASTTIENTDTRYKVQTYKILYLNGKEVSRTLISTDTYKKH